MKKIRISDITMKQDSKELSLSFREKIELAKLLDKLGASVIELEPITSARADMLRIKSIASAVKSAVVAVPVSLEPESVKTVWDALGSAVHPRLQVPAAVSPVQMEYIHHKKPAAMVEAIRQTVQCCKALCSDVEFIARDATRSEPEFLREVLTAAAQAGATQLTLCDTAGTMLPGEFTAFMASVQKDVPAFREVSLGVSCCNTLSMADACSIAAICQGAAEVKAAAYPAGSASLANIARILSAKSPELEADSEVQVTQLSRILCQITRMCETERSKSSPFSHGVHSEEGMCLTAQDSRETLEKAVAALGYDLSSEDLSRVYDAFTAIAAKKPQVSSRELDAIVASAALQVPSAYNLDVYAIQTGNTVSATAHVRLKKGQEILEGVSMGDGPIDAAFLAIEQITKRHYDLDDFQIQAVTEGREAMGQTVVKLMSQGKSYSGRGISTDIVDASIRAYLSALNKIVYEEEAL